MGQDQQIASDFFCIRIAGDLPRGDVRSFTSITYTTKLSPLLDSDDSVIKSLPLCYDLINNALYGVLLHTFISCDEK